MTNVANEASREEYATVFFRVALAAAFLASVIDRIGIGLPFSTANVAWGDMTLFVAYSGRAQSLAPEDGISFPLLLAD